MSRRIINNLYFILNNLLQKGDNDREKNKVPNFLKVENEVCKALKMPKNLFLRPTDVVTPSIALVYLNIKMLKVYKNE